MSRRFVALAVLALTGAALAFPEPALSAGGMRGAMLWRRFPGTYDHAARPARGLARQSAGHCPTGFHAPSWTRHSDRRALARRATRSRPLRTATPPPTRCARSGGSHGAITASITRAGTSRPRSAMMPATAISARPTIRARRSRSMARRRSTTSPPIRPARTAPTARIANPDDDTRDACRAENVTVPAGEGERDHQGGTLLGLNRLRP